jgi:hypothetical protein
MCDPGEHLRHGVCIYELKLGILFFACVHSRVLHAWILCEQSAPIIHVDASSTHLERPCSYLDFSCTARTCGPCTVHEAWLTITALTPVAVGTSWQLVCASRSIPEGIMVHI